MFKFLLFIVIFIFVFGFLFGFSFTRMITRFLFGAPLNTRETSSNQQKAKQATKQSNTPTSTKKIITRDEGEYVDFEEIKD
jgi:hypothetical protein